MTDTISNRKPAVDWRLLTLRRVRDNAARRVADYLLGEHEPEVLGTLLTSYGIAKEDYKAHERSLSEAHLARTNGGVDGA